MFTVDQWRVHSFGLGASGSVRIKIGLFKRIGLNGRKDERKHCNVGGEITINDNVNDRPSFGNQCRLLSQLLNWPPLTTHLLPMERRHHHLLPYKTDSLVWFSFMTTARN